MNSTVSIAYMSESCNDFYICELNVFSFSGARKKVIKSGDEKYDVTIVKNSTKSFKIDLLCPVCNENHSFIIPQNQFWSGQVYQFPCSAYDANILYIGNDAKVRQEINDYLEEEFSSFEKSFIAMDPAEIDTVSKYISAALSKPGMIKICDCGEPEIAYNENKIFIICEKCGKFKSLSFEEFAAMANKLDF